MCLCAQPDPKRITSEWSASLKSTDEKLAALRLPSSKCSIFSTFFFVRWRTSAKMHTVKCILRQLSIYACLHTVIRMQDWRKIHFPLLINTLNELWKRHKPLAVAWRGVCAVNSCIFDMMQLFHIHVHCSCFHTETNMLQRLLWMCLRLIHLPFSKLITYRLVSICIFKKVNDTSKNTSEIFNIF